MSGVDIPRKKNQKNLASISIAENKMDWEFGDLFKAGMEHDCYREI